MLRAAKAIMLEEQQQAAVEGRVSIIEVLSRFMVDEKFLTNPVRHPDGSTEYVCRPRYLATEFIVKEDVRPRAVRPEDVFADRGFLEDKFRTGRGRVLVSQFCDSSVEVSFRLAEAIPITIEVRSVRENDHDDEADLLLVRVRYQDNEWRASGNGLIYALPQAESAAVMAVPARALELILNEQKAFPYYPKIEGVIPAAVVNLLPQPVAEEVVPHIRHPTLWGALATL